MPGKLFIPEHQWPSGERIIITLCGSIRFDKESMEAQKELTLAGHIVISVGCFGHSDPDPRIMQKKEMLDKMHLRKIDMADAIFVVNPGGYVGESTSQEIEYAKANGKKIMWLEPPD